MTTTTHRGTSNTNKRGGSDTRRRRKAWLVETYRADRDLVKVVRHYAEGMDELFYVDNLPRYPMAGQTQLTMISDHLAGYFNERLGEGHTWSEAEVVPACRCYRCGVLCSAETVTADRIVPGCVKTAKYPNGGTYVRENIRPCCSRCNSSTGGALGNAKKKAAKR